MTCAERYVLYPSSTCRDWWQIWDRQTMRPVTVPAGFEASARVADEWNSEALRDVLGRAAAHLRSRERTDRRDGYGNSSLISGRLAAELEDALARLKGGLP